MRAWRAKPAALREEMTLEKLRKARDLSQEDVSDVQAVGEPAVAKLEKCKDNPMFSKAIARLRFQGEFA